jgi:SAM-dependent methyltransferase
MSVEAVANADQERFWNEVAGPLWVATEAELESSTGPFGEAALAAAAPAAGEQVLDVGCGCGSTTLSLAAAVGAAGAVVGVDLSGPMLARAEQRRAAADPAASVRFQRADAQSADLGDSRYDLVFSRFGVMFFADPVAGFANLCRALRRGGRLTFVCWQAPSANPWMAVVNREASRLFGLQAPPHDAPGPFALADRSRVDGILQAAGLVDVHIADRRHRLQLGTGIPVEHWVHQRLLMGPARQPYLDAGEARQSQVRAALVGELAAYQTDAGDSTSGLTMDAAAWIVTARR